jgi:polysaccharide export outer membrane protein
VFGRLAGAALAAILLLGVNGVSRAQEESKTYPPDPRFPQARALDMPQTSPDSTGMDWSRVPEYRIVPGDELRVNFGPRVLTPDEDLVREVTVRPDGRMQVFPVGDVVAAGRTVAELKTAIEQMLAGEYRDPRVSIDISKLAGNQVHVFGRVRDPGSYPAGAFCTLSQAIAMAKGFTDDAHTNDILVFRRDGANTVRAYRVPFGRALKVGSPQADMPLGRYDIVYVPRNAVGNWYVFSRQLFEGAYLGVNTAIRGWELFHLDDIYIRSPLPSP